MMKTGDRDMPIEVEGGPLRVFSQAEFEELDWVVMRIVFDVHNQFGRFLDELLYMREIVVRCRERGIDSARELRVWVRHGSFKKEYKIDLVFSHGVIFEAKAVEHLAPAHEAQTLNYLLLTGTHHGKLINLRPERVEWRFVSTRLTPVSRHQVEFDQAHWRNLCARSQLVQATMMDLFQDWGAFLECNLYLDAVTHFVGGEPIVKRRVPVFSSDRTLGEQEVHLVSDDTAFAITAVTDNTEPMQIHLGRFLEHTALNHIQWINLDHHRIQFKTLSK